MAWTGVPSIRSCLGEGCGHWWWRFTRLPSHSQVLELTTQLNSTQPHSQVLELTTQLNRTQPHSQVLELTKQLNSTEPHSHTARCLSSPPLTRLTPPCNTCLKTNISARMQMCTRSPFYQSHMPELTAPHHTRPAWRRPAQRCAPTHRRIRSPAHHRIRALEQGCIEH